MQSGDCFILTTFFTFSGKHSVPADQKWRSIYGHFYDVFSIPEKGSKGSLNTPVIWEQLAIYINQAKNNSKLQNKKTLGCGSYSNLTTLDTYDVLDGIEMIPDYFAQDLTLEYLQNVNDYLKKAFNSPFHPLANLMKNLCDCFTSTYGGVRVHPRLLKHAVEELHSMVEGIYYFIKALFPALPRAGDCKLIENGDKTEWITATSIG